MAYPSYTIHPHWLFGVGCDRYGLIDDGLPLLYNTPSSHIHTPLTQYTHSSDTPSSHTHLSYNTPLLYSYTIHPHLIQHTHSHNTHLSYNTPTHPTHPHLIYTHPHLIYTPSSHTHPHLTILPSYTLIQYTLISYSKPTHTTHPLIRHTLSPPLTPPNHPLSSPSPIPPSHPLSPLSNPDDTRPG